MSKRVSFFTSESVSEGHPDKVADQISDAVVQYVVSRDPKARVAVETLVKDNHVILAGELTTSVTDIPFEQLVRDTIVAIGYDDDALGFNGHNAVIQNLIGQQSPDINMGVDRADGQLGAGDQGIMFGIATIETPQLFPLAITMANDLLETLAFDRKNNIGGFGRHIRPDAKSQVTLRYEGDTVVGVDTIVISTQHDEEVSLENLRRNLIANIVQPTLEKFGFGHLVAVDQLAEAEYTARYPLGCVKVLINPTGNFVIGGPVGDCGLTGRKIIVDTSGGFGRHGGGAFSGKDPSKVDRSAAYAARWAAKNIVAAGLARKAEIQLSYAIGYPQPTSILVDTFGTAEGGVTEEQIARAVGEVFDFSPAGIIRDLQLLDPVGAGFDYQKTAAYGHFGREDQNFPWELTNRVDQLRALIDVQAAFTDAERG